MNKFTKRVAKFITNKFLAEDMNSLKEEFRMEEIKKVNDEMEYYKNVINKLQKDKNELSSLKFKEQVATQSANKVACLENEKENAIKIENPYAEYL